MTVRFVIIASMRTGSNLLNANLNQYSGVTCHGEVFNPAFIGLLPEYLSRFGLQRDDVAVRDKDPLAFLDKILSLDTMAVGLHMFPGHNSQVLQKLLDDVNVKKICLRRSIFHSFVSLQIAKKTDVWRVTKGGARSDLPLDERRIVFQPVEFEEYRRKLDQFWHQVLKSLSDSKQLYIPVWYRELNDVQTNNRIVAFLGLTEQKSRIEGELHKQNPEPLKQIVVNWNEMVDYADQIGMIHQI